MSEMPIGNGRDAFKYKAPLNAPFGRLYVYSDIADYKYRRYDRPYFESCAISASLTYITFSV